MARAGLTFETAPACRRVGRGHLPAAASYCAGRLHGRFSRGPRGTPYRLFKRDDRPRAGLLELPWEAVRPHWLPYVLADDPAAVVARVESLGGKVLLEPRADVRGGSVGLIADPSGGVLAVQKWPMEQERGGAK